MKLIGFKIPFSYNKIHLYKYTLSHRRAAVVYARFVIDFFREFSSKSLATFECPSHYMNGVHPADGNSFWELFPV